MDIIKKIELVEKLTPTNEEDKKIINDFLKEKEKYEQVSNKNILTEYEYDTKYFEAKREVDSLRDESALDKFYENNVSKKNYNDLLVKLNTIYGKIKKNYDIGNQLAIEEKIIEFNTKKNSVEKTINKVNNKLVLGDITGLNVTDALNGLGEEVNELNKEGKKLLDDMKEFEISTNSSNFSMSPREINETIKKFTSRCKALKEEHQRKYNARVDWTNKKIEEFKSMAEVDAEVKVLIDKLILLGGLKESETPINSYTQTNYTKMMDYNKLVKVNKIIAEIQTKLENKKDNEYANTLDAEIELIEKEIEVINKDIDTADVTKLKEKLSSIDSSITKLEQKLISTTDGLSKEDYDKYVDRISTIKTTIGKLTDKLNAMNESETYDELLNDIKTLSNKIELLDLDVDSLKVKPDGKEAFEKYFDKLNGEIDNIVNKIGSKEDYKEVSQFDTLMDKVNKMKNKMTEINEKINDPSLIKDADNFVILNGDIFGLEMSLTNLEELIAKLEKPIKRENSKKIEKIIKKLEKDVNTLEKNLEKYKEEDEEKYNSTKERLNKFKNRLEEVSNNHKKNTPLKVKNVKSAKNFFKKHKKVCLIIAGLAAMALVSHHVLIPAIIHGNMMIWQTVPALRPFIEFTNKILGGIISANEVIKNAWVLSNGVSINSSIAATSLLKGLAISGVNSTLLVAPLVVAIKKLVEKMKTVELKQKFSENVGKSRDNVKKTVNNAIEKVNALKPKGITRYNLLRNEIAKFSKNEELSAEEKEKLALAEEIIEAKTKGKNGGK